MVFDAAVSCNYVWNCRSWSGPADRHASITDSDRTGPVVIWSYYGDRGLARLINDAGQWGMCCEYRTNGAVDRFLIALRQRADVATSLNTRNLSPLCLGTATHEVIIFHKNRPYEIDAEVWAER